jgi:hypothetical protein
MPFWARCLEVLFWLGFPVVLYTYARVWLIFTKFNRVFDLTEDANTFGRVNELREINRETSRRSKQFLAVLFPYFVVIACYTYLWVVPHAKGVL